jgi:hypothetical protein
MGEGQPPPGTDGYPSGTDGYPVDPATPSMESSSVRSSPGPADEKDQPHEEDQPKDGNGERSPYWAGFESPEAFFDHIEAERAKVQGYLDPRRRLRQIPTPDFPGDDEIAGPWRLARQQAAVRQVGVKLRPVDYDLLAQAAELCGVAPSTLARMLVRRGAQAIVDRDRLGGEPG